MDGTPRELKPIAEAVLAWVAKQRELLDAEEGALTSLSSGFEPYIEAKRDDLRRIELCAQAAQEVALFYELYAPASLDIQPLPPNWPGYEC